MPDRGYAVRILRMPPKERPKPGEKPKPRPKRIPRKERFDEDDPEYGGENFDDDKYDDVTPEIRQKPNYY